MLAMITVMMVAMGMMAMMLRWLYGSALMDAIAIPAFFCIPIVETLQYDFSHITITITEALYIAITISSSHINQNNAMSYHQWNGLVSK